MAKHAGRRRGRHAYQPMNNQLELFFTDTTGNLNLLFKAQNQKWRSAIQL